MTFSDDFYGLIAAGQRFDAKGWLPGGGGNFSLRTAEGFCISVSGRHKGFLRDSDFLSCTADGQTTGKPSAEMPLHRLVYQKTQDFNCVLHVHSPAATAASLAFSEKIILEDLELLKAFPGVTDHATPKILPIFANDQDMERLAEAIAQVWPSLDLPVFLIRGHGFYTWGKSVAATVLQVEALEFMLQVILQLRQLAVLPRYPR